MSDLIFTTILAAAFGLIDGYIYGCAFLEKR